MERIFKILVINPGSTSTKIALFENEKIVLEETIRYSEDQLAPYGTVMEQYEFRRKDIVDFLMAKQVVLEELDGVAGRGGLLCPLEGGTYEVNDQILSDMRNAVRGNHASNLGAVIGHSIATELGIPAYIVDPVAVDEMEELARISGLPEIPRISFFHALNQKAVGRQGAAALGKKYEEANLIVAHLGGGISVGAHQKGRVIDVNNALEDGPFSPERAGGLPSSSLMELCYSGKHTRQEMKKMLTGRGGIVAYLDTNDGREVGRRIQEGDEQARLIYEAMAYQIAKEIGSAATVLKGQVDGILITGGLAHDEMLLGWIRERVSFLAPILVFPGEAEMEALAQGTLRVLQGKEKCQLYKQV